MVNAVNLPHEEPGACRLQLQKGYAVATLVHLQVHIGRPLAAAAVRESAAVSHTHCV